MVTTQIIRPEAIAIDYLTDDVYWSDTIRDTVEVISWNGGNRRTVTRNIPKGISLLIANNDLYIMDRAFSSVIKNLTLYILKKLFSSSRSCVLIKLLVI